jgi:hypothetical protein
MHTLQGLLQQAAVVAVAHSGAANQTTNGNIHRSNNAFQSRHTVPRCMMYVTMSTDCALSTRDEQPSDSSLEQKREQSA